MLLLLIVTGCATSHKEIDNNLPFSSHHFRYEYLDVTWQAERNGDDITITGTVRNIRSHYLLNMDLTARLMSEQGNIIGRGTYADFPESLAPDKPVPFHLKYHLLPGAQGKRVYFSYVYWVVTEGEGVPPIRIYQDIPNTGTFSSPL